MTAYLITLINTVDGVAPAAVDRVRSLLGVKTVKVFAGGRAVDLVYAPEKPVDSLQLSLSIRDLWPSGSAPFDLGVQKAEGPRQKRLLLSDMDATIVCEESLDVLADYAGCGNQVAAITQRAMRGELDFYAALTERVALLRGQPVSMIDRALSEITLSAGAETLVDTMRSWGAKTVLISGGFTPFTDHVRALVGFDESLGNTLGMEVGVLTGHVLGNIVDKEAKRKTLIQQANILGLSLSETIAVGDGANDLPMLQAAGLGVAYRGKPLLKQYIPSWVDISDLTALLYMQGWDPR